MPAIPSFEAFDAQVDGHRLRVAADGADRLAMLIAVIEGANASLRLFYYIFADDDCGKRVKQALIEACGRGVKVSVLVDGFGSNNCPDSSFQPLIDAGCTFARFYPRWGRRYLLRNHQKMVIADEEVALVGGANVSDAYFNDDPDRPSWHDLMIRVEGPAAQRLARYHDALRRWMLSPKPRFRGLLNILARRSEKKAAPLRWLFNGPFRTISPLTRCIRADLAGAKRLDMIEAYFAPNWGMLRRIARIEQRGGEARLVTAARSDNHMTIGAARHCYRRLLRNKVQIFEYLPQMLHMKLIVVDDATYIGSANFDMRSLYINAEIMLRIEDAAFAEKMRGFIAAHEPYCDEITRAEHKKRSGVFSRLRWLVSYFLVSTVDFSVTRSLSLRRR